ncbi:MAG: tetratricopeptide repeat protein [Planctomycetota bacterium]|jgi:tetratricopeptide (TPR) repeat protein
MSSGATLFTTAMLSVVFGAIGGVLGAYLFQSDDAPVRADRYDDSALRAEIRELREENARWMRDLEQRASEHAATTSGPAGERTKIEVEQPPGPDEKRETAVKPAATFVPKKYVASLLKKKFDSDARDRLLTMLSIHPAKIDDTIKELEAAIQAAPDNPDLQTALASAYTSKTAFDTAPGPAQGIPFMKALAAYDKALKLKPDHWTARFGKAFDTSMAPEIIGMRPAAVRQFEDLLERQESQRPQPEFVQSYMRLGTLYKDAGNVDKARATWKRGLAQFPEDPRLKAALELIGEK